MDWAILLASGPSEEYDPATEILPLSPAVLDISLEYPEDPAPPPALSSSPEDADACIRFFKRRNLRDPMYIDAFSEVIMYYNLPQISIYVELGYS
jgi:hypothetical protein